MTALSTIASSLRKIADDCEQADYRPDPFDLRHLARQIEAQDEMKAEGIAE